MRVFAIGIELANNAPIERPHDADPRKHRRAATFHHQYQRFNRALQPAREAVGVSGVSLVKIRAVGSEKSVQPSVDSYLSR
jgi:hypothetical protein